MEVHYKNYPLIDEHPKAVYMHLILKHDVQILLITLINLTSQKIFGQVKEVAVSVKDLVKQEKNKFDAGKYDKALQKLGTAYKGIREKLGGIDKRLLDRIEHLDDRKAELQKEIREVEKSGDVDKQNELQGKLTKLVEDTEKVINSIKQE